MNYAQIFEYCNSLALIGWLLLIFGYSVPYIRQVVSYGIVPILLSFVYAYFIFFGGGEMSFSDFGSLEGVMRLFQSETAVLAGWVHYLVFDLWVGSWEVGDAVKRGINKWLVIPCLFFTFMLGPVGLLMYILLRWGITKRLAHDNF